EHLPLISAPNTLWLEVERGLNNDRNQAALERWSLLRFLRQPRFAVPVLITLLSAAFIVGLALYYRSPGVRPEVSSWDVARLDGANFCAPVVVFRRYPVCGRRGSAMRVYA